MASLHSTQAISGTNNATIKRPIVCVFCGASPGTTPVHLEAARSLARVLHENGFGLVYGGGTVGLMGEVARTLVSLSGPDAVHGIIPEALIKKEQAYSSSIPTSAIDEGAFGRTTIVKDMHTRKRLMVQEVIEGGPGGGFIALSGGFGTMEELMEITTWNQLGIHDRPIVMFNVNGYWNGLIEWVKNCVREGFISPSNAGILVEALSAEEVLTCMKEYKKSEDRMNLKWDEE